MLYQLSYVLAGRAIQGGEGYARTPTASIRHAGLGSVSRFFRHMPIEMEAARQACSLDHVEGPFQAPQVNVAEIIGPGAMNRGTLLGSGHRIPRSARELSTRLHLSHAHPNSISRVSIVIVPATDQRVTRTGIRTMQRLKEG